MTAATGPVYVLLYRQCGHRIMALGDWDVAVRVTELCGSVLAELLPDDVNLGDRAAGLQELLHSLGGKAMVQRTRRRDCWCKVNDAKVLGAWHRLSQASIKGENLDLVR